MSVSAVANTISKIVSQIGLLPALTFHDVSLYPFQSGGQVLVSAQLRIGLYSRNLKAPFSTSTSLVT